MAIAKIPPHNLLQRVGEFTRKILPHRVAEIIGQWTLVRPFWSARILISKDTTWPDFVFWDALRRGKAPGYEIGGLFATPIAQTVASYVVNDGMSASLMDSVTADAPKNTSVHEDGKRTKDLKAVKALPPARPGGSDGSALGYTNMQLRRMMEREQGFFMSTIIDAYGLSEQYVFINPDGTFSVASPETVTCEYSASDYRRLLKVIVKTKYQGAIVTDEYTDDRRRVTIKYYDSREPVFQDFENLIGRIPMVHFAVDRGPNEIHGRVLYEAALPLMRRYDDLIYKTCDGVELLGNPTPAFTGLDNPSETLALNSTQQTYIDEQGNQQTRNLLRFDRNLAIILGKGGDVKMVAPPVGFTKDSLDVLRQLFLLLFSHARIPEFMVGAAIPSSKASTETQLPPFIKYINFRRLQLEGEGADSALGIEARGGFLALIDIWLRTMKLLNPSIVVGPVKMEWSEIDAADALIKYQYVTYFNSTGKVTDEDAIAASNIWDDPAAVVARAQGKPQRHPNYDQYDEQLKQARLEAAQKSMAPDNDDGKPFTTDYVTLGVKPNKMQPGQSNEYSIVGPQVWEGEPGGY